MPCPFKGVFPFGVTLFLIGVPAGMYLLLPCVLCVPRITFLKLQFILKWTVLFSKVGMNNTYVTIVFARQESSHSFFCKQAVDTCVQSPPSLQTVEMILLARDKHKVMFAYTQCVGSNPRMLFSIYLIAFCVELSCGRVFVYRRHHIE